MQATAHPTVSGSMHQLGYSVIPCRFTASELANVGDLLVQPTLKRSRAGIRHALGHPGVAKIASDPRLMGIAHAVLGEGALPFRATLFDKSSHSNWLVAWHQDTALPLRERREVPGWGPWSLKEGINYAHAPAEALGQVLALRLHLDDSTKRNGPLRVLPGTHTLGVLTDQEIHDLADRIQPIECLSPAGGIVAMRPLVVHASSKSQSKDPRRVLHIEYAPAATIVGGIKLAIA